MMKFICFYFLFSFGLLAECFAINVTITQCTFYTPDVTWDSVARGMGMNSTILPETFLDNTNFFSTTDILICSSYDVFYNPTRINNIKQFLATGKSVYLQTEYDCGTFQSDSVYQALVTDMGGSYTSGGIISGTLAPMNVLGSMATTPNVVPNISYFWYGCRGFTGCDYVEPFLEYMGDYFGFIFCPPLSGYGRLITTSDQDWIQAYTSVPLMENILTNLASPPANCGVSTTPLNLGNDTTLCNGQYIQLGSNVSASSYLWSNTQTANSILVNSPGTYWLQISTGSCTQTDTIQVNFTNCNQGTSFNSTEQTMCAENCTDFTDLSTNNPTGWAWSFPGGSPSSSTVQNPSHICYSIPGIYPVTLITTSTNGTDTLTIDSLITIYNVPPQPILTVLGDTLITTGGSTYQWFMDGHIIPGATDSFYIATQIASYSVEITNASGCVNSSTHIITSVFEKNSEADIQFYPNPANQELYITDLPVLSGEKIKLGLYDAIGKELFSQGTFSSSAIFDTHLIDDGVYFVHIFLGENPIVKRVVILHR
ncbi:MAG TPA: T9SS type A sorting domain-containing protein [Bacteroidia bacterium]|nr:T9SS type A sorting domain-containing protein [Bacteroidia bacterium]